MMLETRPNIFQEGWRKFKRPENLIPISWRVFDFFEDAGIAATDPSRPFGIDWERRTRRFNHETVLLAVLPIEIVAKTAVFFTVGVPAITADVVSSPLRYSWSIGKVIQERRHQR
ncbi:MAG: hypothetical protein M1142_02240 [Patescibacteria group bacterium]|nr:hypothetical protein [Patescibacteria group bacterium]